MADVISMLTKKPISSATETHIACTIAHNRAVVAQKEAKRPVVTGWQNLGLRGVLDAYIHDDRVRPCPIIDVILDTALSGPQQ